MKNITSAKDHSTNLNTARDVVAEIEADNYSASETDGDRDDPEVSFRQDVMQAVHSLVSGPEFRKFVRTECQAVFQAGGVELREQLLDSVREALRDEVFKGISTHLPLPQAIEIRSRRKKTRTIKPPFHPSLPEIVKIAGARVDGVPTSVWIWGPKGVGKSQLARQVAEAFGVSFHLIPLSPTTTDAKLVGFKNVATGDFVTGLLEEPYTNGGLAFLDEIDIADPGVLVGLNALLSGGDYRFPHGKIVKRHPDFYVMAGANTNGSGAANGYIRRKLDSAFLDRFLKIPVPLDPEFERAICGKKDWAEYMQRVRAALDKHGVRNFELSPRSTLTGAALLDAGLKPNVVIDLLLADAGDKIKVMILKEVGAFQSKP